MPVKEFIFSENDFRGPGFFEKLGEAVFGSRRLLDCAQIEVTSHCNGACIYCPHTTQAEQWRSRHMQPEVFARLWPLLRQSRRAHLQGWGEPLLNPNFFAFQELAARAGCMTSTTSCGLIMTEKMAEKLANSGMDLMAFSLVGSDEKSNSARAKVPFAKVMESIAVLRKAIAATKQAQPLEIHFAYLMLADRMEAVKTLPELMDRANVEMAVVSTLDYLAAPEQSELAFRPDEEEKIQHARELLEMAAEKAESYGRIIHYALPGKAPVPNGCRENIVKSLYIDADGQVSPCVYLNAPGSDSQEKRRIFGNVNEANPLEIWNRDGFRKFRGDMANGVWDEACLNCPKRVET